MAPALLFLTASCGSYQYSGYGNDGIYGGDTNNDPAYNTGSPNYEPQYQQQGQNQQQQQSSNSAYYRDLFGEKHEQYASVPSEGAIFTDVESYSSAGESEIYHPEQENYATQGNANASNYGPWGSESTSVNINYYGNYGSPMFYYPMWNRGWYMGYGNPYWGGFYNDFGWGWGWGFGYSPFMYGYGGMYGGFYHPYGFAYNHPVYYAPNNYYPRNRNSNVAYNQGRRNTGVNTYNASRANNAQTRNSVNYSRNNVNARNNDYGLRNQSGVRANTTNSRNNNRTINNRNSRYENNTRQNTRNNNNVRNNTSRRSSSGTFSGGSRGGSTGGGMRSGGGGSRGGSRGGRP